MKSQDVTILFLSCDKYADLWDPLFYCFHKYWPKCPYPYYLGSNTKKARIKNVQTLLSGPDTDWSSSFRAILSQISTPYIFLWLDDIFPTDQVNTRDFADALSF